MKDEDFFMDTFNNIPIKRMYMGSDSALYRITTITDFFSKRMDVFKKSGHAEALSKGWISLKGKYGGTYADLETASVLYSWCQGKKIINPFERHEDMFINGLNTLISGHVEKYISIGEIIREFQIGNYRVDLFIPSHRLVIEYDEQHHKYQKASDSEREKSIRRLLSSVKIIRVKKGSELNGYVKIMNYLMRDV